MADVVVLPNSRFIRRLPRPGPPGLWHEAWDRGNRVTRRSDFSRLQPDDNRRMSG